MRRNLGYVAPMALAFAVAGFAFVFVSPALAAQPAKEIAAGAQHAGFAAASADLAGVHMHLHHTINCLVGPEGKGFAPKEENPCAALGNGAIPDTADAMKKKSLEDALMKAEAGVSEMDLAKAKSIASETQTMLKALE